MRFAKPIRVILFICASAIGLGAQTSPVTDTLPRFPQVDGTNLEGRVMRFPDAFEGERNLVFVAFRREQQADVDSWVPYLKTLELSRRGVRQYELPTLNRSYRLMRSFIDGGMARGIPDKAVRETTITLYIDKTPFKKALKITTEDRIVLLLVTKDGRVTWRTEGAFSEPGRAALEAALAQPVPPKP